MTMARMSSAMKYALHDIDSGGQLTDDAILELLHLVSTVTGIRYIEPSVLRYAESPHAVVPTLSKVKKALLIIHLGVRESEGHWVLATYDGECVAVYDPLNSMCIGSGLYTLLKRFFSEQVPITTVPVITTQRNTIDCGVLCSAYAVEWALGGDPANARFDYNALRPHLSNILRAQQLTVFPQVTVKQVNDRSEIVSTSRDSVGVSYNATQDESTSRTQALNVIEMGEQLTDEAIVEVLHLLQDFQGVHYIEPAVLMCAHLPNAAVPCLSSVDRAALIVHLGVIESEGHWVLATYELNSVVVYDPLNSTVIGPHLKQVLQMVFSPNVSVSLRSVATPQRNTIDCGVLCAAYAVEWALGGDPGNAKFDYCALRPHLSSIVRAHQLTPFPKVILRSTSEMDETVTSSATSLDSSLQDSHEVARASSQDFFSSPQVAPTSTHQTRADSHSTLTHESMSKLQAEVFSLLSNKYNIRIVKRRWGKKFAVPDNTLALCHVYHHTANYYVVFARLSHILPYTHIFDFHGRKYKSRVSKREKRMVDHFSSMEHSKLITVPGLKRSSNSIYSHLLSLISMLFLARGLDPLPHLDLQADTLSLHDMLCAYLAEEGSTNDHISALPVTPTDGVTISSVANELGLSGSTSDGNSVCTQTGQVQEVTGTPTSDELKSLVMRKIKEVCGITVEESPFVSRPPTNKEDFMGLVEVVNKQSKNHYFSAMYWRQPRGPVTIYDFCGRTYGRDILELEKNFAKKAIGSRVKCTLQKNPTVCSKKENEKTLLYSLMTLLCIAHQKNIWSYVDAKADIRSLKLLLNSMLEGNFTENVTSTSIIRPLFQRRRPTAITTDLGAMDVECISCNAMFFQCEVEYVGGPQLHCCKRGEIHLPDCKTAPDFLRLLMTENNEESKHFRASIYRYNSAMAFASMHTQVPNLGQGAQAFIAQGQIYTTMYAGSAPANETPKGNQMYFLGVDDSVDRRVQSHFGLRAPIVRGLLDMFHGHNPYAKVYATMGEYMSRQGGLPQVNITMRADLNALHRGTGSLPSASEVAVAYTTSNISTLDKMVVFAKPSHVPQKLNLNSGSAEPMLFPLLNPFGQSGYVSTNTPYTFREYCLYVLARRAGFSTVKYGCRLKQAYICFLCLKMEDDRLYWISNNQKILRAESYKGLHDWVRRRARESSARVGRVVVLPATFTGSPRYMHRKYLDSLAVVCHFGRYDLFITITTNPRWPEITENIPEGQTVADNSDLVNRVFQAKLMKFFDLIEKDQVLGSVAAWLYVIEFQKRGLPHAHCVIIFTPQDTVDSAERVDQLVVAEIPEERGTDRDLVAEFMLHEPCLTKPSAKCRRNPENICRHRFPKGFSDSTVYAGPDTRTEYRRRPSNAPVIVNGVPIDNDYMVPTNLTLLRALKCHVNVEVYQPLLGVKYLFNYLKKGEMGETIQIRADVHGEARVTVSDEVREYQSHRYLSCYEADWRIRAFNVNSCSHNVVRLPVHLESENMVFFVEGAEEEALENAEDKRSQLEGWFHLNITDPAARDYRYVDIPYHYVWNTSNRKWVRRKKRGERCVVRMYDVPPSYGELFYLRLLLLHCNGATSYEDLRSVSGTVYETFKDACMALRLLIDDAEYIRCLKDAAAIKTPGAFRRLMVQILAYCAPTYPRRLYTQFFADMAADSSHEIVDPECEICQTYVNGRLRSSLERIGYDFQSNGMEFLLQYTSFTERQSDSNERSDEPPSSEQAAVLLEGFNPGQRNAFDAIMAAVGGSYNCLHSRAFFLDGPAGTGKTHVLNAVSYIIEANLEDSEKHRHVISMAWSGLAATLLRNGRTAHSTLKLPFTMDDNTQVRLPFQSEGASEIRDSPLIIWDEVSMTHVKAFEAFDRWLRLLMSIDRPFGDKVIIFAGDFRQVLPVVPMASLFTISSYIVKGSPLWKIVQSLKLSQIMRVSEGEIEFSNFLLRVGSGRTVVPPDFPRGSVIIPEKLVCSKSDLVSFVLEKYRESLILCVRNTDVDLMNIIASRRVLGTTKMYRSVDCNEHDVALSTTAEPDAEFRHNLPIEYLNRLNPPSMPPHRLILKVGEPVMLLRNIDVAAGLCNGTRLIVSEMKDDLLVCTRLSSNMPVFLCRQRFTTIEQRDVVPFVRTQFPVKLAYACTVHKSQGQTLGRVGIYLKNSVFTHGMLYVAMSRVRRFQDLRFCIETGDGQGSRQGQVYTRNVVNTEALR